MLGVQVYADDMMKQQISNICQENAKKGNLCNNCSFQDEQGIITSLLMRFWLHCHQTSDISATTEINSGEMEQKTRK